MLNSVYTSPKRVTIQEMKPMAHMDFAAVDNRTNQLQIYKVSKLI